MFSDFINDIIIYLSANVEKDILIILNTKKHSKQCFEELRNFINSEFEDIYYLSTMITPWERKFIIKLIKLKSAKRKIIVSTQLIEAGVDISVDVVFRAMAPIDAIIQASGRANRYDEKGCVCEVFIHEIQESIITIEENIHFTPYILWSLYGIICILLLVRFGKNIWKLISKSKSNTIVKFKKATLVLINEKTLPHTFLNSIFINFEDYDNRKIEEELYTHELVHVTQKHTLDILFIEFLNTRIYSNATK